MEIISQHMETMSCPICGEPKRYMVNADGSTNLIKCEKCNIQFQRVEPGKWKITRISKG